jgi:hypothetical protein
MGDNKTPVNKKLSIMKPSSSQTVLFYVKEEASNLKSQEGIPKIRTDSLISVPKIPKIQQTETRLLEEPKISHRDSQNSIIS